MTSQDFGSIIAVVAVVALVEVIGGGYNALWGEREGLIETSDCRAKIPVEEGSRHTWFTQFTCSYRKTKGGEIMSGFCEAVETDSAGKCETVYFYTKKVPNVCADPKLYLGEDDGCHAESQ